MSLYIVLEAKYVRNWKREIHWWAHYLVRNKKIVNLCVYRPWSLDMRCAYDPPPPPPPRPARPPPPATTCPRLATETHQTYQWEIGCLVDGVGGGRVSRARPSLPISIRFKRDGVRIRVKASWCFCRKFLIRWNVFMLKIAAGAMTNRYDTGKSAKLYWLHVENCIYVVPVSLFYVLSPSHLHGLSLSLSMLCISSPWPTHPPTLYRTGTHGGVGR